MSELSSRMACLACGAELDEDEPYPFRCPKADEGDDVAHVLVRQLDLHGASPPERDDANPFVRFRELLHSYRFARRHGMSDEDFVDLVADLDRRIANVDGRGVHATPYLRSEGLGAELGLAKGGLWIKDETGNVAGSHKVRHLAGIALWLDVLRHVGAAGEEGVLAISSCGNAALAAAVVARAAARPLEAFVPADAPGDVLERLEDLHAKTRRCERRPGDPPGDPCFLRLQEAVRAGALPFTCQGSQNGMAIEGGETLAWEVLASHAELADAPIDRVVIQVGGGALASSFLQALREARELGMIDRLPRVHAMQTAGGHPLERAWRKLVLEIVRLMERRGEETPGEDAENHVLATWLFEHRGSEAVSYVIGLAAEQRSTYMRPWEPRPESLASGILDDETHDWLCVLRGMIDTGGWPIVVDEETIARAWKQGREATGIDVDPTGTAGLAGVLRLAEQDLLAPAENVAVLFTGVRR